MPVSHPPPPVSGHVTRNFLSGVGCGWTYDGLTHDDLAGDEVADAEGSPLEVRIDAEHDALDPAWRQLVRGFGSPWRSPLITLSLTAFAASSYQRDSEP